MTGRAKPDSDVTIVLPTFNRASFLPQAFASISSQTLSSWQLVVVDDGSTDATRQLVSDFAAACDRPVTYVYQENKGAYSARNRGLEHADSPYVAFFDSDDVWLPEYLERCVGALEAVPEIDWVFAPCRMIDTATGLVLQENTFFVDGRPKPLLNLRTQTRHGVHHIVDPAALECSLQSSLCAGLQNSVMRRSLIGERRFNEASRVIDDQHFVVRVLAAGAQFGYLSEPLVVYNVHEGNSSGSATSQSVQKLIGISRETVLGLESIRAQVPLGPRALRALNERLAAESFWQLGYNGYWQAGQRREALRTFRRSLRLWPWAASRWKTFLAATARYYLGGGKNVGPASPDAERAAPKTVVYVAKASFFAGAERALILLLQGLDPARYSPYVIVGTDGEMHRQLESLRIPTTYIDLRYTDWTHPIAWVKSVRAIKNVIRSVNGTLIHSNGVPGFQPAGYAARVCRLPRVVHVRGRLERGTYSWFLKPGFDRALFVSQHLLDYASEQDEPTFRSRSDVVYDGVLLPRLPSEEERLERLAEMQVPSDRPSIVLSGQVVEVKGIWEYIEAARLLVAAGIQATFVVLGEDLLGNGETRRKAEATVSQLGLADYFRFLGFRPNAPDLIPLFDIATVPSHNEPLGNATLEAMAAGLPVVGSRVGGIPEMIVDGETGLLIPPRDGNALAAALSRLIEDASLRVSYGQAGRRRAESVFGVAAHALRVQQVYDQVLEATGRVAAERPVRSSEQAGTITGKG